MSHLRHLSWIAILGLGLAVACADPADMNGEEEESPDVDACEHLNDGPFIDVTPTETATVDNNAVFAAEHTAYRVDTSGTAAFTSFSSDEAAEFYLYIDSPTATVTVWQDDAMTEVTAEESVTSSADCAQVEGRFTYDLEVANYFLQVEDNTAANVLVYLAEADHDHAHED